MDKRKVIIAAALLAEEQPTERDRDAFTAQSELEKEWKTEAKPACFSRRGK